MKTRTFVLMLLIVAALIVISACTPPDPDDPANLANPAAVHCTEQGHDYEIRTDESGGQYGVCVFPDGSECDGWAYFRGECGPAGEDQAGLANPASVFCQEQGYTLEIRSDDSGEFGVCVFPDGSECEEWAFFRGECAPGES